MEWWFGPIPWFPCGVRSSRPFAVADPEFPRNQGLACLLWILSRENYLISIELGTSFPDNDYSHFWKSPFDSKVKSQSAIFNLADFQLLASLHDKS